MHRFKGNIAFAFVLNHIKNIVPKSEGTRPKNWIQHKREYTYHFTVEQDSLFVIQARGRFESSPAIASKITGCTM
jgi:hypothetical protein